MKHTPYPFFALMIVLQLSIPVNSSLAQEPASSKRTDVQISTNAMQDYMKLISPGEGHKLFSKMTGRWTAKMKIWNSTTPSAPPMESTEETESKLILGGRFLAEESKGTMMGMPMQRVGLLGYDNYKKIYTLVFYSNLDTATNSATGNLDTNGVLILRGEFDDPTGKTPFKNVVRFESDDVHVFESYKILPDGKELKVIEEIYTRVK